MDEREASRGRASRRAGLRALPTPTDVEIFVADQPALLDVVDELPEPRIADLDALLRDVDDLRATIRRDLTLAATAAEAGADEMAGWLLLGDGGEVRAFEERALGHLRSLEAQEPELDADLEAVAAVPGQRRGARMFPAAPLVAAAAAVVGFLTGVVPGTGLLTSPKTSNSALESYAELTQLASNGASPTRLSEAAQQFHEDLAPLVAAAATDPAAAAKAIALLQSERAVIAGEADSPALRAVLAQADALVRKLQATLPRHTLRTVVTPPVDETNQQRSNDGPKSTPAPRATTGPSPTASPRPSPSPSASSSPKSSASPSDAGLPHAPGTLPG